MRARRKLMRMALMTKKLTPITASRFLVLGRNLTLKVSHRLRKKLSVTGMVIIKTVMMVDVNSIACLSMSEKMYSPATKPAAKKAKVTKKRLMARLSWLNKLTSLGFSMLRPAPACRSSPRH